MGADLYHIVVADFDGLAKAIARDLKTTVKPHYREIDLSTLHERCKRLVEEFVESVRGHPERFAAYVASVAKERISEGYYLSEIQRALSVLHDRVWELAVRGSSISTLVLNLAVVSRTIGAAKDALAQVYFAHKGEVEEILARSGVQAEELFKGTDAGPQA